METRYKITPQMRDYDRLGQIWCPYTMFSQKPNFTSQSVNTDNIGQRLSGNSNYVSPSTLNINSEHSLVVGASTAFGVGATNDSNTISSNLNLKTGDCYISLCGRAYNSKQELLLFLDHIDKFRKIKNVILVTGINNIYLSTISDKNTFPFFFSNQFYSSMENIFFSKRKRLLRFVLSLFGFNIDLKSLKKTNLLSEVKKSWGYPKANLSHKLAIINVELALKRTLNDLIVWKYLSESMAFNLIFCLQPLASWSKRNLCSEEALLFDILDKKANIVLKALENKSIYKKYLSGLKNFCYTKNIRFIDLNSTLSKSKEWVFVDRVHLTDIGYEMVSNKIYPYL